ncbi:MAG TPA: hypothetical protein VGF17_29200 [Phytomonospora sp.]
MSLPKVTVMAAAGEPPTVTVDGNPLPGVRSAQITVSKDGVPQVALVLAAAEVDLALPAAVTVMRAGRTASEFAAELNPVRLEQDALARLDDLTHGEAFAAAVAVQAALFDGDD